MRRFIVVGACILTLAISSVVRGETTEGQGEINQEISEQANRLSSLRKSLGKERMILEELKQKQGKIRNLIWDTKEVKEQQARVESIQQQIKEREEIIKGLRARRDSSFLNTMLVLLLFISVPTALILGFRNRKRRKIAKQVVVTKVYDGDGEFYDE